MFQQSPRIALGLFLLLFANTFCAPDNFEFQDSDGEEDLLRDHFGREYNSAQEIIEAALIQAQVSAAQFESDDIDYTGREPEEIEAAFEEEEDGSFTWDPFVEVVSADGTVIRGNLFHPVTANPNKKYPAIIFVNSWSLDEHEYIVQAAKFAKDGYIVLSYSTRGFGFSEGLINVAGPKDMEDLDAVLDYLEDETQVQPGNVGISGISYGAGISLIGLGTKNRIKTAVAMSGWTDLIQALWGGESPRLVWGALLISAGYLTGRMDPEILENFAVMLSYNVERKDDVVAWAELRSAKTYIDGINEKKKPVYISNNFQDDLFQPNMILDFYRKLEGPKKLDLNQGIHASAELTGLLGLQNRAWDNAHDWFDRYLKGIDTGIEDKPAVTMEKKFSHDREQMDNWPPPSLTSTRFTLKPRTTLPWRSGKLLTGANNLNKDTKYFSGDTFASTGIPLVSPILEAHLNAPVRLNINDLTINRLTGVYYMSDPIDAGLEILGEPTMNVQTIPGRSQAMYMVYLYDVDSNGRGTLITHGTRSLHEAQPKKRLEIDVDLVATAYDVAAGNRLAVVVDTFDIMYSVPTLVPYSVKIAHRLDEPSTLTIPHTSTEEP